MTCAPAFAASCTAAEPTPPVAPTTSTVSPALTRPVQGRYQIKPPLPYVPGGEIAGVVGRHWRRGAPASQPKLWSNTAAALSPSPVPAAAHRSVAISMNAFTKGETCLLLGYTA